jgi:hypothetical protein
MKWVRGFFQRFWNVGRSMEIVQARFYRSSIINSLPRKRPNAPSASSKKFTPKCDREMGSFAVHVAYRWPRSCVRVCRISVREKPNS